MNKMWKIIAAITALILIGVIFFFTNAFVGNPISKYFANKEIANYINQEYGHLDLDIVETGYNFKDSSYFGLAQSKTSQDTHFYVHARNGKVTNDDYSFRVERLENTVQRFEGEYSLIVRQIIKDELNYPKNDTNVIYMRDENAGFKELFQLDAPFDPTLPIKKEVFISLKFEDPSLEGVTKLLESVHESFKKHDHYFDQYSFMNEHDDIFLNVYGVTPAEIESGELKEILEKDDERFIKNK